MGCDISELGSAGLCRIVSGMPLWWRFSGRRRPIPRIATLCAAGMAGAAADQKGDCRRHARSKCVSQWLRAEAANRASACKQGARYELVAQQGGPGYKNNPDRDSACATSANAERVQGRVQLLTLGKNSEERPACPD